MVRTIIPPLNHHNQHVEQYDQTQDVANGDKIALQKPNNFRSKHSLTEQRRRSKINRRFQLLRDIIPPIDQKRDKASLLLEVIEYIQFLQEKLQVYEQLYQQFWSQEPTKLIPWRANHGPVDNYANNSQTIKNVFLDENTAVQSMATIQDSVKSEFEGEYAYRADHSAGLVNPVPLNIRLQPSSYPLGTGIQLVDNLTSHPHGSFIAGGAIMGIKERTFGKGSSSVSDVYSQGLRKKLIKALQSSGVDISQADISVQLEVGEQVNSGSTALVSSIVEDAVNQPPNDQPMPDCTEVSAEDI